MKLLLVFSTIYATLSLSSCSSAPKRKTSKDIRENFALTYDQKDFAFYFSTFPVAGLDEAIWRKDLNGNLLMVGLKGCEGCLCYTFDHRYPIDHLVMDYDPANDTAVADLMTSPANIQALNYRTNLFKSNLDEEEISSLMPLFGFDEATMQLFTKNEFEGAKEIQNILYDSAQVSHCQRVYNNYKRDLIRKEASFPSDRRISEEWKRTDPKAVKAELDSRAEAVRTDITQYYSTRSSVSKSV